VTGNVGAGGGRLVRPYALTGGRVRSDTDLPIETLVVTTPKGRQATRLAWERRAIADLCVAPLAVAEVAARLRIPLGVARVLVGDMTAEGMVQVYRPAEVERPDLVLLERVLDGLQAL
jgi:hypothetical protein